MKKVFVIFVMSLSWMLSSAQENNNIKQQDLELSKIGKDSTIAQLSNWGYGAALFLGYNVLSGDLQNKFKNALIFGIVWDFEYKNVLSLGIEYSYGASKTKEDITLTDRIWNEDYRANFHRGELALTTKLLNNKDFSFMPLVGIAYNEITSIDENHYYYIDPKLLPPYEQVRFDKTSFVLGCILYIKTMRKKGQENGNSYGGIRIKYTYNMTHFEKKYAMFSGEMHAITVGFGGFIRKERKIKS